MKLIIGLGNPGKQYENTRHNVGFLTVENLVSKIPTQGVDQTPQFKFQTRFEAETVKVGNVILAKPQTYMNESGRAVSKIFNYYFDSKTKDQKLHNVYVIHDDLDLSWGQYKIQLGKGPKVHNGVNSIEQALGSTDFWRVRVGVDNRTEQERQVIMGRDYVLKKLNQEEQGQISEVINQISATLLAQL